MGQPWTSTTLRTALIVERAVNISCPSSAQLAGSSVLVELSAEIALTDDEFVNATIDYGDGRVYDCPTLDEATRNMFRHYYKQPGQRSMRDALLSWTKS